MARAKSKRTPAWSAFDPPPEDALACNAWMFRALATSAHKAMQDGTLSEPARRRELREIASAMRGLIPQTRLHDAEDVVRGDDARLQSPGGPEMEDATPVAAAGGRSQAKRGRPRRRALL